MENEFINQLKQHILQNLSNDKFGVSELADAVGMSRSNLLRRVQKLTNLSVSLFIRQVRLSEAMEMLKQNTFTVSEVSYKVGFSSTSYFIKCFRELYGYPPGEIGKVEPSPISELEKPQKKSYRSFLLVSLFIIVLFTGWIFLYKPFASNDNVQEKSIAVLPFINDSNDSDNVYIINGLMESILDKLQQLEGLKVVSRTSVEKYRNSKKSIPEIAKELNVSYVLEGSGQKIGDEILLSMQLVQAPTDDHLWSEQYNRGTKDIFSLQAEVAQKIANEIQVIISPDEEQRIKQVPTDNLEAYDNFLKGIDLLNQESMEGLQAGIPYLLKAVEADKEFARAHAALALAYYYMDLFQAERQYTDSLNYYADKALLYNPKLAQGLTAKALYYIYAHDYEQAVSYLEKALEYNPNSAMVINTLSDLYTTHIPDTEKYLKYALRGVSLDIASNDSSTASYIYLHLSNALIQTGFTKEALVAIDKSLVYNPNNLFSEYVKAYIMYAKYRDLEQTKNMLIQALSKDSTRFDIIQEIGNTCYYQRNWDEAYIYFKQFMDIREALQLDVYIHRTAEIGLVYEKMGLKEESAQLFQQFKAYVDDDKSIYKHLNMALYYAHMYDKDKALHHLRLFSEQENFQYWIILFIPNDPLIDKLKDHPEFIHLMKKLEQSFWKSHNSIRNKLESQNLLTIN